MKPCSYFFDAYYVFYNCSGLVSLENPKKTSNLNKYSWRKAAENLEKLYENKTLTSWDQQARKKMASALSPYLCFIVTQKPINVTEVAFTVLLK